MFGRASVRFARTTARRFATETKAAAAAAPAPAAASSGGGGAAMPLAFIALAGAGYSYYDADQKTAALKEELTTSRSNFPGRQIPRSFLSNPTPAKEPQERSKLS